MGYLELPIKRLKASGPLSAAAETAIRALGPARRTISRGGRVVSSQDGPHFLLDGWACRARTLETGRRQIFDFVLPGDAVSLPAGELEVGAYDVLALTSVTVADASSLLPSAGPEPFPDLLAAFKRLRASERMRLLDHVVRLGSRSAQDGLVHLLLELHARHAEIGMADGSRFPLPIGQERLGEMLGLSAIHVNRTLSILRRDGHLRSEPGWVVLHRPAELAQTVGFTWPSIATASPTFV